MTEFKIYIFVVDTFARFGGFIPFVYFFNILNNLDNKLKRSTLKIKKNILKQ